MASGYENLPDCGGPEPARWTAVLILILAIDLPLLGIVGALYRLGLWLAWF